MNRMEETIRFAAVETMARRMLRDCEKNPERTARNLVDFGCVIAGSHFKDAQKKELSRQLTVLLEQKRAGEALRLLTEAVLPAK